jgi:hypothetical protein
LLLVAQAKLASSPSHGGEGLLLTNGEEEREKVMIRYGRSSEGILSLYSIITRERERVIAVKKWGSRKCSCK